MFISTVYSTTEHFNQGRLERIFISTSDCRVVHPCWLGPSVITCGNIISLLCCAVFGLIQRHNLPFCKVHLTTLDVDKAITTPSIYRRMILGFLFLEQPIPELKEHQFFILMFENLKIQFLKFSDFP